MTVTLGPTPDTEWRYVYRVWNSNQTAYEAVRDGTAVEYPGVVPADLADMAVTQAAHALRVPTHDFLSDIYESGPMSGIIDVHHRATGDLIGTVNYEIAEQYPPSAHTTALFRATVDGQRRTIIVGTADEHVAKQVLQRDLPSHAGAYLNFAGHVLPDAPSAPDRDESHWTHTSQTEHSHPYWSVPMQPLAYTNEDGEGFVLAASDEHVAERVYLDEFPDDDPNTIALSGPSWVVLVDAAELEFDFDLEWAEHDTPGAVPLWHVDA